MVQKPIWKPEYFPWVPPSHRPTPCQSFHYPPHPIKPSRSHQDPIRWPTPCGGCKCFKMGSKQCNSIKAIEGQHETSPKIRSQGGAGPFHQRGKYGEFMLHQVFRGNSWGVKRVLVRPRPKWQSYLIIPPPKKKHRRCQKLDTSGSINTLRVPQSCFLSKPVLKTLLQTLAPVCRFCQPKNGQSKVGNFITMEKKHLTDKRYLGICNLQYSRIWSIRAVREPMTKSITTGLLPLSTDTFNPEKQQHNPWKDLPSTTTNGFLYTPPSLWQISQCLLVPWQFSSPNMLEETINNKRPRLAVLPCIYVVHMQPISRKKPAITPQFFLEDPWGPNPDCMSLLISFGPEKGRKNPIRKSSNASIIFLATQGHKANGWSCPRICQPATTKEYRKSGWDLHSHELEGVDSVKQVTGYIYTL